MKGANAWTPRPHQVAGVWKVLVCSAGGARRGRGARRADRWRAGAAGGDGSTAAVCQSGHACGGRPVAAVCQSGYSCSGRQVAIWPVPGTNAVCQSGTACGG
jgi:hypothetical protein